ncbi:MAG: tetratricopeptide repeat protein [Muribaculaceae bacterium]|nr:tetratricopeptide repeat protein [Muribaculaceae bacterium]
MRKIHLYIIMCLAGLFSAVDLSAQTPLESRADSAYTADDFTLAAELYSRIIAESGTSSALYYNLGNCYYRLGKTGKAIVAYERALRLDPTNASAKTNLEFVNSRIFDRQGERGSFMSNSFDKAATITGSNTMAWIAFGFFVLCLGGIALYIFSSAIGARKVGFFGAIVMFLLTVCAGILAARGASIATNPDTAIIVSPSALLSTSPREPKDRREEAMLLHEGTKLEILDSISAQNDTTGLKWLDIKVDNHHRAWIKSSDIERI